MSTHTNSQNVFVILKKYLVFSENSYDQLIEYNLIMEENFPDSMILWSTEKRSFQGSCNQLLTYSSRLSALVQLNYLHSYVCSRTDKDHLEIYHAVILVECRSNWMT